MISGGVHTVEGLKAFIRETATDDRIFTELIVTDFQAGLNLTNNILKQELPNGVIRVHLPNEGINKNVRSNAYVTNNQGEKIKGIKTLFPIGWTQIDVENAGQAVINQQQGIVKNDHIFGTYKGVRIEVRLDSSSGIINTVHPAWEQ